MTVIALTGGTGFVGRRVIAHAVSAGHVVRALTRRAQPAEPNVSWVRGALDRTEALADLVQGADVVIHVAGVVSAPDRATFAAGNVAGTQAMIHATRAAGISRFIHVSSLAAREPDLSNYGWSKAQAERTIVAADLDATIVRPPAVYGPGDMEMRDLFRFASLGLGITPPPGRLSLIHVDDLARLLIACALAPTPAMLEPDDGTGGITHAEFARMIGTAVGRSVLPLPLPRSLLMAAAWVDGRLRGDKAKLTRDRVAYMVHPDWTTDPARRPPPGLWQPQVTTQRGLIDTAAWYRAHRLL